ncbi:hypothetical protein Pan216_23210 [Planctomycetes bacterium Pan216]|uniref:Uncharacterized protein n=1 Tax=Kolteria novifilia TaxID=2527975 RepID=A0A518B3A2_9BACT|nr:hypothetical protein Pan216_23210 [Planctomycetes bacterium Pan216]
MSPDGATSLSESSPLSKGRSNCSSLSKGRSNCSSLSKGRSNCSPLSKGEKEGVLGSAPEDLAKPRESYPLYAGAP